MPRRQRAYELNTYVFEYASRPIFWAIGALMLTSWTAMIVLAGKRPQPQKSEAEAEASEEPPEPNPNSKARDKDRETPTKTITPHLTGWFLPHITSRSRKNSILLVLLAKGLLEGREGYWVAVTAWRFGAQYIRLWPAWSAETPFWIHAVYLFSAVVTLLLIMVVLWLVAVIVLFNFAYIFEILGNSPVEPQQQRVITSPESVSTNVEKGRFAQQGEDESE